MSFDSPESEVSACVADLSRCELTFKQVAFDFEIVRQGHVTANGRFAQAAGIFRQDISAAFQKDPKRSAPRRTVTCFDGKNYAAFEFARPSDQRPRVGYLSPGSRPIGFPIDFHPLEAFSLRVGASDDKKTLTMTLKDAALKSSSIDGTTGELCGIYELGARNGKSEVWIWELRFEPDSHRLREIRTYIRTGASTPTDCRFLRIDEYEVLADVGLSAPKVVRMGWRGLGKPLKSDYEYQLNISRVRLNPLVDLSLERSWQNDPAIEFHDRTTGGGRHGEKRAQTQREAARAASDEAVDEKFRAESSRQVVAGQRNSALSTSAVLGLSAVLAGGVAILIWVKRSG